MQPPLRPDRNIALEMIRVTEAAAIAAARWVGRGDKNAADGAAVDAMRFVLGGISMDGIVVIGEGEKDEAPMLYNGELIGDGQAPQVDVAVDPVDGTSLTAAGRKGALAVIALSERGTMFNPGPCVYMKKVVVGPRARGAIDINASAVAGAIACAWPNSGVDILFGTGGTPEGVIAAAALQGLGGEIQGILHARDDEERHLAESLGYDFDRVLRNDDLVASDNCYFSATAITDGDFLRGVRFHDFGATTQSLVVRSRSGTVRTIETFHRHDKLQEFSTAGF
ncbi:MAG: fructose-bisphosphatase class II family protein [Acidimicrobiales bacterium]